MRTEAILLFVLTTFQLALSKTLPPQLPFRGFVVASKEFSKPISGTARLDIDGENITNITTMNYLSKGNCTVDIIDGGVGYSYVSISVNVSADMLGAFYMYLFTTESSDFTEVEVLPERSPILKDESSYFIFDYGADYVSTNSSRSDKVSFSFDKDVTLCTGRSLWFNGNGSREVNGGIVENFLDVVFSIPEGVSGDSMCGCYYSSDDSRNVRSVDILPTIEDEVVFSQLFETFGSPTSPFLSAVSFAVPYGYELLSYEGIVDWRNGTGQYNITTDGIDGSMGCNINVDIESSAYSYGIVDCDFLIKAS